MNHTSPRLRMTGHTTTKKFFLLTLLLIPGSMFGMFRNASKLKHLTKRLRMPSQNVRRSMQRFIATRRRAQVTKSMVPAFMQKRLVNNKNNQKDNISAAQSSLAGVALGIAGLAVWSAWMSMGFEMISDPDFIDKCAGLFCISSGLVLPLVAFEKD